MTIQEYIVRYLDKVNPKTGRPWMHDEVAATEGIPAALVQQCQAFAADCYTKKINDPATIQNLWDKAQAAKNVPKPPVIQPGAGVRKIGDVPENEFWARMRTLG